MKTFKIKEQYKDCYMTATVKVPDIVTEAQQQWKFYTDMLKTLERKKKKTPGNGFAMIKCREKLEEIENFLDRIDYQVQFVYD